MDNASLLLALDREGRALAAAARRGVEPAVPSCAGWTVHDVVGHVGRVYRSVGEILRDRLQEPPPRHLPAAPVGVAVVDFYEEAHGELVELLGGLDPDEAVWTWSGDHRVGFYSRRMANETAVHRWDTESAHGHAAAIDADQALDAIDEYLDIVLPFSLRSRERELPAASLHLHRTDGDGEWLVEAKGGALVVERAHRKGAAAVRAPASDLLLLLWNRVPPTVLEVHGEVAVAGEWAQLAP